MGARYPSSRGFWGAAEAESVVHKPRVWNRICVPGSPKWKRHLDSHDGHGRGFLWFPYGDENAGLVDSSADQLCLFGIVRSGS